MIREATYLSQPTDLDVPAKIREILEFYDPNPDREGLIKTPERFTKAFEFLTSGYKEGFKEIAKSALFENEGSETVTIRDIEFYSLCEHHLLPFFGVVHVSYAPDKRIIGLSKIGRIVDVFARRLQVQERLTREIAEALAEILSPKSVYVQIEASHLCMMMRGVQKQNSKTITQAEWRKKLDELTNDRFSTTPAEIFVKK